MAAIKDFNKKAAVFLVKFFLIYAVLQYLILALPLFPLEELIASTEATWLGLQAEGNGILFNSHRFEIVENCSGLMSISVLAAIVFSLRKPELKKKVCLFAVGALILFPLNFIRVYFVLVAAISLNPDAAEALHVATWFTTSAAIMVLWYYLTKKVSKVHDFAALL